MDTLLAESFIERNEAAVLAIIAVAVGAVTLFAMWFWRERDKQSKTFDYQVIDDLPVFSGHERPADLKVTYRGEDDITDPRVTRVRFKNTGKQPIEYRDDDKSDVWEPYYIERGSARLLDVAYVEQSVTSRDGETLADVQLVADKSDSPTRFTSARVIPKKLNSGAWFTIQLIFDGGGDIPITVSGQLRGETRPSKVIDTIEQRDRRLRIYGTLVGLTLLLLGWILKLIAEEHTALDAVGNGGLAAGGALLFYTLMKWADSTKKDGATKD